MYWTVLSYHPYLVSLLSLLFLLLLICYPYSCYILCSVRKINCTNICDQRYYPTTCIINQLRIHRFSTMQLKPSIGLVFWMALWKWTIARNCWLNTRSKCTDPIQHAGTQMCTHYKFNLKIWCAQQQLNIYGGNTSSFHKLISSQKRMSLCL